MTLDNIQLNNRSLTQFLGTTLHMLTVRLESMPVWSRKLLRVCLGFGTLSCGGAALAAADWPPNPVPRQIIARTPLADWEFKNSTEGWRTRHQAVGTSGAEFWQIRTTGHDPMLESPGFVARHPLVVRLRMRSTATGHGQLFWGTAQQSGETEANSVRFDVAHDGNWHDYEITLPAVEPTQRLRLDPATGAGEIAIDRFQIEEIEYHPLEMVAVRAGRSAIELDVRNHRDQAIAATLAGISYEIAPSSRETLTLEVGATTNPFSLHGLTLSSPGLPSVSRQITTLHPEISDRTWPSIGNQERRLSIAPDGLGGRIYLRDRLVAQICPLLLRRGIPSRCSVTMSGDAITCSSDENTSVRLTWDRDELRCDVRAREPVEGPVLRVLGNLEQGLLAGVEHLGRGERSSSDLDLRGPEHVRFAPDRFLLTMPLMALVTDQGSVAIAWSDQRLQPVLATPNFLDGTRDHRLSLRGEQFTAWIRIADSFAEGTRLEDAVLWLVRRWGLPELPAAPRSLAAQRELDLAGLSNQELMPRDRTWHHAILPGGKPIPEQPQHFADLASAMFRLTGQLPDATRLTPGGSHIANETAFLLAGRGEELLRHWHAVAERNRSQQREDGSYRYDGPLREGHFENTSSGHCARPALELLEHARRTGNRDSLEAALRTLEFMKRFRTPRGASVWECPLHAPDLLASTLLVQAYVRGFELTGNREFLRLAVRWALSGIPYVYLWSERPIMAYATIGTLCATHYQAPVWIGRPVQWMGIVYADALLDLAPHDQSVDWQRLSLGILRCAEQMQYTEGPSRGLLPDSFVPRSQQGHPYDINPSTLIWLRLRHQGTSPGLSMAIGATHRLASPFPVRLERGHATVIAPAGTRYQVIVDGVEVREITSLGEDHIPFQ